MPTQPRADSPFAASLLQREMGQREPGTPTTAGKPGIQPGGVSFPAPPAVASAAPGRPSGPSAPAPTGFPEPPQPAVPAPPAVAPTGAQPAQPAAAGQQAQPALTQPMLALPRQPVPAELLPGVSLQTPHGTVETDARGEQELTLSPEGRQRYAETVMKKRQELGPMPKVFTDIPGLPQLPVEPGRYNFNPFTGRFGR